MTSMEWILLESTLGNWLVQTKMQVSIFQPLKKLWSHHKFPTNKNVASGKLFLFQPFQTLWGSSQIPYQKNVASKGNLCVFFFDGVYCFCCYLFLTWVISPWWTLNLTKPPFFQGKTRMFCCFSSMVFSSKRQAYATIGPRGSLLQKRFRLSGRRPWGPAILDFSIRESCRLPKPMVGPMGGGGGNINSGYIHVTIVGVIIWHRPKHSYIREDFWKIIKDLHCSNLLKWLIQWPLTPDQLTN